MVNRFIRLKSLPATIEAQYGNGLMKYCKFIYYSLICVNKFNILKIRKHEFNANQRNVHHYHCAEIQHDALILFRKNQNLPREYYADMQSDSMRCFGVTIAGTLCHIHWVHDRRAPSRFLSLGDGEAEISHIVTLPEYRGQGICAEAVRQTLAQLLREGCEHVYSVVHSQNVASLKALAKAGMTRLRDVHTIGPFNRRIRPDSAPREQRG